MPDENHSTRVAALQHQVSTLTSKHAEAKAIVTGILQKFGWETEDMGVADAARAIEPLCILWCIPGFLRNDWTHAFKLLKK